MLLEALVVEQEGLILYLALPLQQVAVAVAEAVIQHHLMAVLAVAVAKVISAVSHRRSLHQLKAIMVGLL